MRYPKFLEKGDCIAVTAPSEGFYKEEQIAEYDNAIKNIRNLEFEFLETDNVRKYEKGRSSSAKERAKQFMEVWQNPKVNAIICAKGGDFACEMLDYLDFEVLKKIEPKWLQGFSDITNLGFVFTTNLDIATIYGENIRDYGMKELFTNLTDSIKIMQGKGIVQKSFHACEPKEEEREIFGSYCLTRKTVWRNLKGEEKLAISGRALGGCLDVIVSLIGTKYDKVREYIKKYKEDGIIWFFDIYEMSTPEILRHLWQMKSAGYFEHCKGILFGRPFIIREDYEISLEESIENAIGILDIPVILDCDIGHVPPQMPIVNGAILEIESSEGEGIVKTFFR